MKNLLIIVCLACFLASCYDEFRVDNPTSAVAFSTADGGSGVAGVLHRSVVKDEGLKLEAGIFLTGILDNKQDRWADFVIDSSLMWNAAIKKLGYELMPASYYTLSNPSRFEIKSGSTLGKVTIVLDSVKFLSDPKALKHIYAIPFRLTATSEDSIVALHDTKIIVVKYINHYAGFYDQTSVVTSFSADGVQKSKADVKNVLTFTTLALDTVVANGMVNMINTSKNTSYEMKIVVNPDNSVEISNTAASAANVIVPIGPNTYDPKTSTFILNYKVVAADKSYQTASATLVWRNRIRDGINEWRR
jgi:hypothetical protein